MNLKQVHNFFEATGDNRVTKAIPERKRCGRNWYGWIVVVVLISWATVCVLLFQKDPETAMEPARYDLESGMSPAYFYYGGCVYVYHGTIVYALSDGYELIGEVNKIEVVGDILGLSDFDGNVDGYVYMNPEDDKAAYFQWKNWDELIDGEKPYLLLSREEIVFS